MVHEEFYFADGRGVCVRIDDCTPQEQQDVSAFFTAVDRLNALERRETAALLSVVVLATIGIIIPVWFFGFSMERAGVVGKMVVYLWMPMWVMLGLVAEWAMRVRMKAVGWRIARILARNERCMTAAKDLRRMNRSFRWLLHDALPAPSSGTDRRASHSSR